MHYTGQVYRPPLEIRTPLLEVTIGCSYNKCSFCTMYHQTPFKLSPLSDVREDVMEIASYYPDLERIYLLNGDLFVLSTNRLVEIANLIKEYLPKIKTITCYASFYNLKNKSVEDLKKLKALGYDEIYIGVETALPKALNYINKGSDISEYKQALEKLKNANMSYHAILMLGIAGRGNSLENAKATAEFLNFYPPKSVFPMTADVQVGSKLYQMRENGEFVEATIKECLEEQISLVENLDMPEDSLYSSGHAVNLFSVSHRFKHKNKILKKLHYALDNAHEDILSSTNSRHAR